MMKRGISNREAQAMKRRIVLSVLGMVVFPLTVRAQQPGMQLVKVRVENGRIVSSENVLTDPVSTDIQEEDISPIIQDFPENGTYGRIDSSHVNPSGSLLLADLSGSVGVTDGTGPDIVFGYSISNGGNSTASNFHVHIVLSHNTDITTNTGYPEYDVVIADYVRSLPPMNISDVNSIQADVGQIYGHAGTYYLGIIVDATSIIAESNEDNNTGYDDSPQVVIQALPDLIVTSLSLDAIGSNSLGLTFSFGMQNKGNIDALFNQYGETIRIGTYLSVDANIDKESDYYYGSINLMDTVARGETRNWSGKQVDGDGYCDGILQGTYYFGIYIDSEENLAESREFNNTASVTSPQVPVPALLPDLIWNQNVNYNYITDYLNSTQAIDNYGWNDVSAPFNWRIVLSSDQSIDDGDWFLFEGTHTALIERTKFSWVNYSGISVKDIPAGSYYLINEVDAGNQITELSESNNTVSLPIDIIHLCMVYPNGGETWVKGNTYTVQWTTEGTTPYVTLWLMKNSVCCMIMVQGLSNTGSYVFTPPLDLEDSGDYQIVVFGVSGGLWRTSDISDGYFTIQTTAPPVSKPDLVVQTVDVLDGEGPEIRYQCTVKNNGDAAAGESKVKFHLSSDTQISSSDHLVDTWTVTGTLSAGESRGSGERTTTVSGVPAGEYYLGAIADADDQVSESSEGNNSMYDDSPKVTIPASTDNHWADLDGDGDVDIADVQMVAGRWGAKTGDANYLAVCDVDGDGDIDIVDVQMVAALWGTVF
jgi:hypothetical protein